MSEDKARKIIFLDLDHVLTNTDLDNTSFKHLDPAKYRLSSINLKFLDKILDKTGAKIVIASNWRKFSPTNAVWNYNGKEYHSVLEPFKKMYKDYIIDMLPNERHATKCDCLDMWFEDNPWFSKLHDKYAILEDDTREGYQHHVVFSQHLVLTDYHFGLTEEDASKAIALLEK